jgi:hypothetical protein
MPTTKHEFAIKLSAVANVKAVTYIKAATVEEAEEKALEFARGGNCDWSYDGVDDDGSIRIEDVRRYQ